jgi:hypothetical protein
MTSKKKRDEQYEFLLRALFSDPALLRDLARVCIPDLHIHRAFRNASNNINWDGVTDHLRRTSTSINKYFFAGTQFPNDDFDRALRRIERKFNTNDFPKRVWRFMDRVNVWDLSGSHLLQFVASVMDLWENDTDPDSIAIQPNMRSWSLGSFQSRLADIYLEG